MAPADPSLSRGDARPIFHDHICQHYGRLIADLSKKTQDTLQHFLDWAQAHPLRWSLFRENTVSPHWHKALMQEFFQDSDADGAAVRVLDILQVHGRLKRLPEILTYARILQDKTRIVYLRAAKVLDRHALQDLTQALQERWSVPVRILQTHAPDLLLGGILVWDHWMMDASLRSLFNHFQTEMIYVLPFS